MPLIIIESPAKIKKIAEYSGLKVVATGGHFRELAASGMNVDLNTYEPVFTVVPGKEENLAKIKVMAKGQKVFLASDPDREGDAIAQHTAMELKGICKEALRVEIREITKSGITNALSKAVSFEETNQGSYNAFLGRRVTDRIVGYLLSPKASRELAMKGMSIGRVQTVALRLVVEKERDIRGHKALPYWFVVVIVEKDGVKFNAYHTHGRFTEKREAQAVIDCVKEASYATCTDVETLRKNANPKPPFTTASLQMAASSLLGVDPETTMKLSQSMFEAGLITYPRTDAVRISDDVIENIRNLIMAEYGKECVPAKPVKHEIKKSQNAHEGIRPTSIFPIANARKLLTAEGLNSIKHIELFDLIWKRTIASQMAPAIYELTNASLSVEGEGFKGVGRVMIFDGFQRVYCAEDECDGKKEQIEQVLPFLEKGNLLSLRGEGLDEKKTKAPGRYSSAGLIEKLEALGIGRPSTYASILGSLTRKKYVETKKRMLAPTEVGEKLYDWADRSCSWLLDYQMTCDMEETLDLVERGEAEWKDFVKEVHGKMGFEKSSRGTIGNEPTEKQVRYAERMAKACGVILPAETKKDRKKLSGWLDKNSKKVGSQEKGLSVKQIVLINKHGDAELRKKVADGDIITGRDFLNSYFKKKGEREDV